MANQTIGTVDCPMWECAETADVRKNIKGKLYLYCPSCGMIQPNLKGAQDHIKKKAHFFDDEPPGPVMESEPDPGPEPVAEPGKSGGDDPGGDDLEDWFK